MNLLHDADSLPPGWLADGVIPVGYCDLDGRPGFKLSIKQAVDRWYLYLGHFWHSGWSVVDVTDPSRPSVVRFIEGPPNTGTLQVDLADSIMVTALEKILPGFGGDPNGSFDEGVVVWSLEEPTAPRALGQFHTGGTGTHRSGFPGGQYVHLAANMAGFSRNIYVIIDISNPSHPVEVGRWWVSGQHLAGGETPQEPGLSLHGPPVPVGDLVYLPYGSAGVIVLDIRDVTSPCKVGELSFSPPFRSEFGVHSVVPHPERGLAYVNSEGAAEHCCEGADHASVIDIHDPEHLSLISVLPRPRPPEGAPYADFCDRPGWSGPHNQHQLFHNPDVAPRDDRIYLSYFNAGLRIFDVGEPRLPTEMAWFLPPDPVKRFGPQPPSDLVVQSEDVLVDRRGFVYLTDKNQGLWILRVDDI
jgi:hypothetical protein